MTPMCFVDTETDGVHPGRKPWEIALIRREPGGGEFAVQFLVDIDLSTADPFGLKVGRFYDRHPFGREISTGVVDGEIVTCRQAALNVAKFTHGAHLVGAVPNFDAEVFDRLLRTHGLCPSWHYHLIDVESLAVGYLAGLGDTVPNNELLTPPWKSDDLTTALGVEPPAEEERHTALGDARWAMRVYDHVMGGRS